METPHFHKQQLRHEWERIVNNYPENVPVLSHDDFKSDEPIMWYLTVGDLGYVYNDIRDAHEDFEMLSNSLKNL